MSFAAVRSVLIRLHRWIGLGLAPVFLLIILSGAVLSLRPMLSPAPAELAAGVDAPALISLMEKLEADGAVNSVAIGPGGTTATVASPVPQLAGQWDIATATRLAPADDGPDIFAIANRLHKSLLLGLGLVVEVATFAMAAIMIAGPFLTWLRLRNSLIGWHMAVGWLVLPLTLLSPLTAVLMILGIGQGARPPLPRAERPLTISQALSRAGADVATDRLVTARRFRGGTVMVRTSGDKGGTHVVGDAGAVALTGGPGLVKQIHEGTWGGAWSGGLNLAVSLALLGLTVTGFASWFGRWRRDRAPARAVTAEILVVHASQTGTAARLAHATAAALTKGGASARVAPLGAITPAQLRAHRMVLLIAATTGEGEVPDGARRFVAELRPRELEGVRFAVLGLGDRRYTHFCRGAETLDAALRAAGGAEIEPLMRVDGDPGTPWHHWMQALGPALGLAGEASLTLAPAEKLVLAERHRLDEPSPARTAQAQGSRDSLDKRETLDARTILDTREISETRETWAIALEAERDLVFRPGDLLRLSPPAGGPARAYSIGSSSRVDPRRIQLTVRLHRHRAAEGTEGLGQVSGLLVRLAPLGAPLAAHLDPHPAFHPPADPGWPILMIAAGSGIAPFPGFLAERRTSGRAGPAWLIFGNRSRTGDFLWRAQLEGALADGTLTRLDTAFSRDGDAGAHVEGPYVQDRLRAVPAEVLHWIDDLKAVIYVCGSRKMARAVEEALAFVLASRPGGDAASVHAELERWRSEGRLRVDAFD